MNVLESNLSSVVWLVATQYVLYAAGWALCSRMLQEQRAAVAHWAVFMAFLGLGMALTALRDEPRTWWAYGGANAALFVGFVLLRRGAELFAGVTGHDREHLVTLLVVAGLFLAMGAELRWAPWRVMLAYGSGIWVLLRTMQVLRLPVQQEFGRVASWLLSIPALVVMLAFGVRLAQQALNLDQSMEMHRPTEANRGLFFGYLIAASMYNFAFVAMLTMRLTKRLQQLSERDPLTGLANRRVFERELQREWQRLQRGGPGFAILALDLDHFKRINDNFGHLVGDAVLAQVAQRLQRGARATDTVARTGGEEFVILMPLSDLDAAQRVAERVREAVRAAPVETLAGPVAVTLSIGAVHAEPGEPDTLSLLRRADQALYEAKQAGRDRVHLGSWHFVTSA
jgi:diguanylate cyclase (GGDEF)-like protein